MNFIGSQQELAARLEAAGVQGKWEEKPNNVWRFLPLDGGGMNWSANKGTIWCDGPVAKKEKIERQVATAIDLLDLPQAKVPDEEKSKVFVVHGHDSTAREQLELILHKLGLDHFILQNTDGGGLTIIESLEAMIGKNAKSSFGIVLLTPDDMGYAKKDGEEKAEPRARQNVVLEMGMLLASLTRDRVVILKKGHVEAPSDIAGVNYVGFNDHVKEAVPKLVGRLHKAGFDIPADRVTAASS